MLEPWGFANTQVPTASLVPIADLFVAFASSTIRWAIACAVPTVNYDVFHYGYGDFADTSGVLSVQGKEEFRAAMTQLVPSSVAYAALSRRIAADTKATIRCIPFQRKKETGKCIMTGKPSEGRVVFVSSTAGQRGEAEHSAYASTKGALISYTKSLAAELGPRGIRVNCIAPGWVETDLTREALSDPERRRRIEESIPLGHVAQPEEIAGPVLFLVSDLARHVQGEVLNVNGGSVLIG